MTKLIVPPYQAFQGLAVQTFAFTAKNVTAFTDSGGNTGLVLQTVPIGAIPTWFQVITWSMTATANLSVQTLATTWTVQYAVRDTTVQAGVTVAQFIAATPTANAKATFAGAVAPPIKGVSVVLTETSWSAAVGAATTDAYANAITSGDSIAIDFGVWLNQNKANQTGTWAAALSFSVIFV